MHDLRLPTIPRGRTSRAPFAALLATTLLASLAAPATLPAQQRGGGAGGDEDGPAELNAGLLSSFRWRSIGPATV